MAKKSRSTGEDEYRRLIDRRRSEERRSQAPSDEDFARACANMAERESLFEQVRQSLLQNIPAGVPLHDIFVFGSPEADYDAFVFYNIERDVEECRRNETNEILREAIVQAFAAALRCGKTNRPTIRVVFDSDEHVKKACNGNYLSYLR